MVHCFDGVESNLQKWRPSIATNPKADHPSTSIIFAEQCFSPDGEPHFAPGVSLFGHACSGGGVILRPGTNVAKVMCGHGFDHGAYCGPFCKHVPEWQYEGEKCSSAWAPEDMGVYLYRDTQDYRANPGWGHYNELLVDGHSWDEALPWSVEAFISSSTGLAEKAHKAFLAEYGLSEEGDKGVPILTMTPVIGQPFVSGEKGYGSEGDPTRGGGRCKALPCNKG